MCKLEANIRTAGTVWLVQKSHHFTRMQPLKSTDKQSKTITIFGSLSMCYCLYCPAISSRLFRMHNTNSQSNITQCISSCFTSATAKRGRYHRWSIWRTSCQRIVSPLRPPCCIRLKLWHQQKYSNSSLTIHLYLKNYREMFWKGALCLNCSHCVWCSRGLVMCLNRPVEWACHLWDKKKQALLMSGQKVSDIQQERSGE